MTQSRQRNQRK